MLKDGQSGGEPELIAASRLYGVSIIIVDPQGERLPIGQSDTRVYLAYTGTHYDGTHDL